MILTAVTSGKIEIAQLVESLPPTLELPGSYLAVVRHFFLGIKEFFKAFANLQVALIKPY